MHTEHIQPMVQYLENHGWISQEQARTLEQSLSQKELHTLLIESGVLTAQEIERLEALFAGMPPYRKQLSDIDRGQYEHIPYEYAQNQRIISVGKDARGLELITDRGYVDTETLGSLTLPMSTVYRVSRDMFDQVLEHYRQDTIAALDSSIERTLQLVRKVDSYGSRSMAMFFPADHQREIAEDVSTTKLLRALVARGRIEGADTVIIRPGSDKVQVDFSCAGRVYRYGVMPKSVEGPLYLKLRYLADMSLDECRKPQSGMVQGIGHDAYENFSVDFIPQTSGVTMMIYSTEVSRERSLLLQAGLSDDDTNTCLELFEHGRGMVLVTGLSGTGKTFALYHVLESAAVHTPTLSYESVIEYVVDGVDQTIYSKRPDKDIQATPQHYGVIGLLPVFKQSLQAAYNLAGRKLVLMDYREGVLAVVKQMLALGIPVRDIAQTMRYNLVSYRYPRLDGTHTRSLRTDEAATLEEYCPFALCSTQLKRDKRINDKARSWSDCRWYTHPANKRMWWNTRLGIHAQKDSDEGWVYVRALADTGKVLRDSHRDNLSLVELGHEIQYAQKRALVTSSIEQALSGEVAIDEVIAMLRA